MRIIAGCEQRSWGPLGEGRGSSFLCVPFVSFGHFDVWQWINMNISNKSVQFSSVSRSCPTLCNPVDYSTPGFPVHHQLPELAQTHGHWVGDAIQPSHPLSSPSPSAFNLSQPRDRTQVSCIAGGSVFPVVMYGRENCTIKKAEHWRIDAFELWCWRRLLTVPWTARRSNQSILKEISPEYSLERLMLKLQYFGHLMGRTDSFERPWCWERLKAGGEGDDRRWDGWMASPTWWTWVWASSGVGEGQGSLVCYGSWGTKESDMTERLN